MKKRKEKERAHKKEKLNIVNFKKTNY